MAFKLYLAITIGLLWTVAVGGSAADNQGDLYGDIEQALLDVDRDVKNDIRLLMSLIAKNQGDPYEGLLDFMGRSGRLDPDEMAEGRKGKLRFLNLFNDIIEDTCRRFNEALEPVIPKDTVEAILDSQENKSQMVWIIATQICGDILEPETPYSITDEVYSLFLAKYN